MAISVVGLLRLTPLQVRTRLNDPFRLVYLLNEDFFNGGLTDVSFRSDRKAPRG